MAASLSSTPPSSSHMGSVSSSVSVICEEVFDDSCQPSAQEIAEYAVLLGIDPIKEEYLLYLAKEGLMAALPDDWKICYSEEKCGHYYFNLKTKKSQWDHPLDNVYRNLVMEARRKQTFPLTTTSITGGIMTALLVDNSDDASQLDSGIRSLPATDDYDNTNNTANEMSSPSITNINTGAIPKHFMPNFNNSVSQTKNCITSNLVSNKCSRFELLKTYPEMALKIRANTNKSDNFLSKVCETNTTEQLPIKNKSTFALGSSTNLLTKQQSKIETDSNQTTNAETDSHNIINQTVNIIIEGVAGTPPGVKGILRDSSLLDMRKRIERVDNDIDGGVGGEDKKSVRFNLDESKLRDSPEDEPSSSRRFTQSPEVSVNSDEDDNAEHVDPFDDDDEALNDCVDIGNLPLDLVNYQRCLNPFLANHDASSKQSKIVSSNSIQSLSNTNIGTSDPSKNEKVNLLLSQTSKSAANFGQECLNKFKENAVVKPLYDDTDSESKGSSIRSFIINRSEQDSYPSVEKCKNPFDAAGDIQQLDCKSSRQPLNNVKMVSKLVHKFENDDDRKMSEGNAIIVKASVEEINANEPQQKNQEAEDERQDLNYYLENKSEDIQKGYDVKLQNIRAEYENRLITQQQELDSEFDKQLLQYRQHLEEESRKKRQNILDEHKTQMSTLQQNHAEILSDLERDLKSEEEILKKEHSIKLLEMREKLQNELELEKQRMREAGDDRVYEKVRCEKRLLEDKYRCLKEKYIRLKTDVKLSLERRNRRREVQAQQQILQQNANTTNNTGSETERSTSNKPSVANSENRSLSYSTSCQISVTGKADKMKKPLVPSKAHLQLPVKDKQRSIGKSMEQSTNVRKPGIASKYIQHLQSQKDTTASLSQSDTTISNNYSQGRHPVSSMTALGENGNSDSELIQNNQENNNNEHNVLDEDTNTPQRRCQFSRLKSASTSRLNTENYRLDRSCIPVEILRNQLQKLEDLEDQFPDSTLEVTYHLRYPFSDILTSDRIVGTSSELEFFKHRIHLERDSVRRAKEALRTQRTNFRSRQREVKLRHKNLITRHALDQLIQEEKELTEMEVNLHRTRALLGEKVIRLRHLEQSLLRMYDKDKPCNMELRGIEHKDDATLSDISSHSSSGFSSTEFASGNDMQNVNKRNDIPAGLDSNECIKNLEILNAEIKEILDILGKTNHNEGPAIPPIISQSDADWQHILSSTSISPINSSNINNKIKSQQQQLHVGGNNQNVHVMHSIPTLADRLETYRQLATGRMQNSLFTANTIVSQNPLAVSYTTSLVERTRDLRNWLQQAKTEHELFNSMSVALNLTNNTTLTTTNSSSINSQINNRSTACTNNPPNL